MDYISSRAKTAGRELVRIIDGMKNQFNLGDGPYELSDLTELLDHYNLSVKIYSR